MSKKLLAECFKIFNEGNSFYENKSSASENSATVRVHARYRAVCRIKVDDGIVKKGNTGQVRCDFLFVIEEGKTKLFLFVELKGSATNGEDAANQLINTIDFFKGKHGIPSKDDKIVSAGLHPALEYPALSGLVPFEMLLICRFIRYLFPINHPSTNAISAAVRP